MYSLAVTSESWYRISVSAASLSVMVCALEAGSELTAEGVVGMAAAMVGSHAGGSLVGIARFPAVMPERLAGSRVPAAVAGAAGPTLAACDRDSIRAEGLTFGRRLRADIVLASVPRCPRPLEGLCRNSPRPALWQV